MSDPLHEKIIDGLGRLTDREKFEACAAALLRKYHPRLVPIPGGADAGFDGAAVDETGNYYQLVCTTSDDVIGNLTGSLEMAKRLGRKSNIVLLATSRRLSPVEKRNLEKRAGDFGKVLHPVYDQEAIAELLYHNSRWRKALLNLPGNPPAFSLLPAANRRPNVDLAPLGREIEQAAIAAAIHDQILVGQPGSGKTHLLAYLARGTKGLFLVSTDLEAIAEGLRDQQPRWLIVDDASSRLEELRTLRQVRSDMGADFRIVATCWPGQEGEVATTLGVVGEKTVELAQLPPRTIRSVIHAMGIGGPDQLVRELIHQSHGKPGLAVTLCAICWNLGTRELFTGDALTRDVGQSLKMLAGEEAELLLAYFALAGGTGLTIEQAATATRMTPLRIKLLSEKMGAAGVLNFTREGRLSVEPLRLRQALVRDTFRRPPSPIDWRGLIALMPDRINTVETLIASGFSQDESDEPDLRREIEASEQSSRVGDLCRLYAQHGPDQCRWVLARFPTMFKRVAEPLLFYLPMEILPLLLRSSLLGDQPIRHSRDELPEIRQWINHKAVGTDAVECRIQLLESLEQMIDQIRGTATLLAGVRNVMAIHVEWTDQEPGEAMTIRVNHGFVPQPVLEQVAKLWPRVFKLLAGFPLEQVLQFPQIFVDWAIPRPWKNGQITPDFIAASKRYALAMFDDLAKEHGKSWVVLNRWNMVAMQIGYALPTTTGLPAVLFPQRGFGTDREAEAKQGEAVEALGIDWARLGPEVAPIEEWLRTIRQAEEAKIYGRDLPVRLAYRIAHNASDPEAWLNALASAGAPEHILGPFAGRSCGQGEERAKEFVARFIGHPTYGALATEHLVRKVPPTAEIWRDAKPSIEKFPGRVGVCVRINAVPQVTLASLLIDFSSNLRSEVAVSLWAAEPRGEIPEALRLPWREAFVFCVEEADEMADIAEAHPDLAFEWLNARLNQKFDFLAPEGAGRFFLNPHLPKIIAVLNRTQRSEIIDFFDADNCHTEILAQVIGDDLVLFKHALERPATADRLILTLGPPGEPPEAWVQRVNLLLGAGRTEEEIINVSSLFRGGSGLWSQIHEETLAPFRPLTSHSDQRIRRIATTVVESLSRERDRLLADERKAAIRGEIA